MRAVISAVMLPGMANAPSLDELIKRHGIPGLIPEAAGLVSKYGSSFIGARRPKGLRRQASKECFLNSANPASEESGLYCEGAALKVAKLSRFTTLGLLETVDT